MLLSALPTVIHLNTTLLSLLIGSVIPFAVSVVAKAAAPDWVKAASNASLSIVGGALSAALVHSGSLSWEPFAYNIAITWITSVASYFGLWKPVGVTAAIAAKTANFGFGKNPV